MKKQEEKSGQQLDADSSAAAAIDHSVSFSFDYDGCLQLSRERDVISGNDKLWSYLKTVSKNVDGPIPVWMGTNRQDAKTDNFNRQQKINGSCFEHYAKTVVHLNTLGINASLEKLLLVDVYQGVDEGSSFDKHISIGSSAGWSVFDQTKIHILYAHAHALATKHPKKKHTLYFFDDHQSILQPLIRHYTEHTACLPKNVTLVICEYDKNKAKTEKMPNEQACIKGTGETDNHYQQTLRTCFELAKSGRYPSSLFTDHGQNIYLLNHSELITRNRITRIRAIKQPKLTDAGAAAFFQPDKDKHPGTALTNRFSHLIDNLYRCF